MPGPPLHLLYVCTANICRSAFAEALSGGLVAPDRLRVTSAGTHAPEGRAMDPLMVAELERRSIAPGPHTSRKLGLAHLESSDLVLTMTVDHRNWILDDFPQFFGKVYTLRQFVKAASRVEGGEQGADLLRAAKRHRGHVTSSDDIVDPYGRGPGPTAEAAAEIDDLVRTVVSRLAPPA